VQEARELKSFGKYRLIASLGAGGMAKVYLALMAGPAGFNKLLVIKILREDLEHLFGASAESVQMFWKEARLAARLSHPNIVQTHEVGEVKGHYFIAMEYLDGQPYSAVLSRLRKHEVSIAEHLRIVSDVARALHYSHTLRSYEGGSIGIVHRDVSPHNIIATYDGQVKLLDFGVATTDDPEHVTRVGVIKGKLDYIAPEQLRGEAIDGRADIFALGAVLWEALSGHRFGGGRKVSDALKVQSRLSGGERKLRDLRPTLPEELVSIVECAIALDPGERFADAATFADALDAYIVSMGERPSPQSLSAILTPVFEAERTKMTEIINTQLSAIKNAPPATESTLSRAASALIELDDETGDLPHIERDSDEGLISFLPEAPGERSSSLRAGFARAASSIPSAARMRSVAAAPRTRDTALLMVGTMAAGAALALLWPRSAPPDHAATVVAPQQQVDNPAAMGAADSLPDRAARAPDSVAPRVDPAAQLVLLEINVAPPSARLMVDGVSVQHPFSGQFRKDPSLHLVEAQADGYRTLKQFVKFERDQTLALALSRSSAARQASPSAAAVPARAAEAPAAAPRREAPANEPAPAPTKSAPRAVVPGADIDVVTPAAGADDIYQANPYRKQK
jgi:serine/threonine-protein kinase